MKKVDKVICTVAIIFFVWLFVSWVDVLCHNAPRYGDGKYHPCNVIVMFAEAAKK